MRVLIAGDFPEDPQNIYGGIQAVIYFTLTGLVDYPDLDIHIVTCEKRRQNHQPKNWNKQSNGWTTHFLTSPSRIPHSLTFLTLDRWQLKNTIQSLSPDLIHAHGQVAAYPWAAYDTHLPVILTVHGINTLEAIEDRRGGWLKGWLRVKYWNQVEKACLRQARDIVVISPFVADTIQPYTKARFHWIENPVEPALFQLNHQEIPNRILYVGSIQKRKGLFDLIQAVSRLISAYKDIELRIAGEIMPVYAEYGQEVLQLIERLDLHDHTKLLGHLNRQELLKEYQSCSVLCLPSYVEASPVAIAEGMAAGCPVVTSDIGSTAHLVTDGLNGLRFSVGNAASLAEKLDAIFRENEPRLEMGLMGRKMAFERFTPQIAAQATHKLYIESATHH